MKVYIQTFTGMGRTYNVDVEPSTTTRQLKKLLEKASDNKDLQTMCFGFNGKSLDDDDQTLSDYDIKDGSLLQLIDLSVKSRSGFDCIGTEFANLSNRKGLKTQEWSKTAPLWRKTSRGLSLEGSCTTEQCAAYQQRVVMPIGYKRFDILADASETTTICPLCKNFVEPQTCSFNNCWWKYQGIKQEEVGKGKPPKRCSSDWQYADNAYHYFDQQTSGMVRWKQLIVEAVENKPQQ